MTPLLAAVVCLSAAASASASTTTVTFDDLALGTSVTSYPAADPVIGFGDPSSAGFQAGGPGNGTVEPTACGSLYVEAANDAHSKPNLGNFAGCFGTEGETFPSRGSFATLSYLADTVSMYVGSPDASDKFELDAYDANRNFLGSTTITATAAGPNNLIQYSTPGVFDIAYFAIYETSVQFLDPSTLIGIDDLSLDLCTPGVDCAPGVRLPVATVGGSVARTASQQYKVTLSREDGSTGPVDLTAAGLPSGSGVTASFDPSILTGTEVSSILTITATASAPLGALNDSIVATPEGPSAGTVAATEPLGVSVVAPFSVGVQQDPQFSDTALASSESISVQPCSSAQTDLRTSVGPGYIGSPVSLGLNVSGDTASVPTSDVALLGSGDRTALLNPSDFDPSGYNDQTLKITRTAAPTAPGALSIAITPSGPPGLTGALATITVNNAPPTITRVTYTDDSPITAGGLNEQNSALTPQADSRGAEVTIDGSGFCPGTVVEFGNAQAVAPADSINSEGTQITVQTPMLATTGPLIVGSGGSLVPGMTAGWFLTIDSYRNTRGFSFHNFTPNIQDKDMQNAFGFNAVYDSVDVCVIGCTVSFFDPLAKALEWFAQDTIGSASGGGACFGFSLGSYQLIGSIPGPTYYFGTNSHVYPLARTEEIPDLGYSVQDLITASALKQFSSQFLGPWLGQFEDENQQGSTTAAVTVYNQIKSILHQGRPAMISLEEGGSGHEVDAYELQGSPPDYNIEVYDSNDPFGSDGDENTSDGAEHKEQLAASEIHVAGGSWSLQSTQLHGHIADFGVDLSKFSVHDSGLVVTDPATIPFQPTPISDLSALVGLVLGGDVNAPNSASAAQPSVITQVSDGNGHTLLTRRGTLNHDPATTLPGAPFAPATSATPNGPITSTGHVSFVLGGAPHRVDATIHETGTGPDSHTIIGPGFMASVATHARRGTVNVASASAHEVGFTTTASSQPLTLSLSDRRGSGATGATRTFQLTTTSFGHQHDDLSITKGGTGLLISHHGPATTASVTISTQGNGSPPETFASGPIAVPANGTDRVSHIAWNALQTSKMTITAHGRTVTIRNRHDQPVWAVITRLRARKLPAGKVALTIVTRRKPLPVGATRTFAWSVMFHGHKVNEFTTTRDATTRAATITFTPPHPGRYTLTGAEIVTPPGGAGDPSVANRTLAFDA